MYIESSNLIYFITFILFFAVLMCVAMAFWTWVKSLMEVELLRETRSWSHIWSRFRDESLCLHLVEYQRCSVHNFVTNSDQEGCTLGIWGLKILSELLPYSFFGGVVIKLGTIFKEINYSKPNRNRHIKSNLLHDLFKV